MNEQLVKEYTSKIDSVSKIVSVLINNYNTVNNKEPTVDQIVQWFNMVSGLVNLTTDNSNPDQYTMLMNSIMLNKEMILNKNAVINDTSTTTTTKTVSTETHFDPTEPIDVPNIK